MPLPALQRWKGGRLGAGNMQIEFEVKLGAVRFQCEWVRRGATSIGATGQQNSETGFLICGPVPDKKATPYRRRNLIGSQRSHASFSSKVISGHFWYRHLMTTTRALGRIGDSP
ncbi:hypothetical protein BgiBS90_028493 [Biomphalaria glabrata]|nr:hypothetical protein BgiBS90_028493 [Biomphalaria glabrata]